MQRPRFPGIDDGSQPEGEIFRFPRPTNANDVVKADAEETSDVLYAFERVSRRMEDLARTLGCLGFFDDDDGPRAA